MSAFDPLRTLGVGASITAMHGKRVHKAARMATIGMTVVGAVFGSVAGVAASSWGGVVVIVPIATAIFAVVGALVGAAIEFAIRWKNPIDHEL